MNNQQLTKIKIYYLDNKQKSKHLDRFSHSQIILHPHSYVTNNKGLIHLSTSLQKQKKHLAGTKQLDQNQFIIPRFFYRQKYIRDNQFLQNEENNQISCLGLYTNTKRQITESINYFSDSKFNKIDLNHKNRITKTYKIKNKINKERLAQNKFYSFYLGQKEKQPKNLAAIVKQKWNKKKIISNLRKTERTFKSFILNSNNNLQEDMQKVTLKIDQSEKLNESKRVLKKRFFEYKDDKIKQNSVGLLNLQRSHPINESRVPEIKVVFNQRISDSQDSNPFIKSKKNKQIFGQKRFKMMRLLHSQQENLSWWSKPEILRKVGQQFNFKKTIAY